MSDQPFELLELGSNSLKHYRIETIETAEGPGHRIKTRKLPWRIAHEFYRHGVLSPRAIEDVVETLLCVAPEAGKDSRGGMICLATGVFRELPDTAPLSALVKERTGLRLRIISGEDEAKLMGRSLSINLPGRAIVLDLGGASTEWTWVEDGRASDWGSLPLGAIRNHCQLGECEPGSAEYVGRARELCAPELGPLESRRPEHVYVTGGTARALAQSRGERTSLAELQETIARVEAVGPPEDIAPERQEVYLSGLVVFEQLLLALGAEEMIYSKASVREGMARRLLKLLRSHGPDDLHTTLLLRSSNVFPTSEEAAD